MTFSDHRKKYGLKSILPIIARPSWKLGYPITLRILRHMRLDLAMNGPTEESLRPKFALCSAILARRD
jgi:hypothetical protein